VAVGSLFRRPPGTTDRVTIGMMLGVLAYFLFGEPFGIKQIGGIALIIGGVVLINQA